MYEIYFPGGFFNNYITDHFLISIHNFDRLDPEYSPAAIESVNCEYEQKIEINCFKQGILMKLSNCIEVSLLYQLEAFIKLFKNNIVRDEMIK